MISAPETEDVGALCDWAEAWALFDGRLSRAEIEDAILEGGLATNETSDILIANVWRESDRRTVAGAQAYPLRWEFRSVARRWRWDRSPAYSFMLLLSLGHYYEELTLAGPAASAPARLFERICTSAYQVYLGGLALRFGHPRQAPMPQGFTTAIEYVCRETREEIGHGAYGGPQLKDDGLDIVAWKSPEDGRSGQVVILAQCATGRDWEQKVHGLDLDLWRGHIRWAVGPIKSIAIPRVHTLGNLWNRSSVSAGLVMDRLRLARLIDRGSLLTGGLRAETVRWCQQHIRAIPRG